jgi:hypothetical protein
MSIAVSPHAGTLQPRRVLVATLVLIVPYYAALLTLGSFDLFQSAQHGMTFNSMLEHMLHGRFDVDPDAVGREGFAWGGRVYAYWGVFCALLRLPLLLMPGGLRVDVTVLSCLVAACLGAVAKLRALLFVRAHVPQGKMADLLFGCMYAYVLLGGAEIGYLVPSIFQEVVFWAAAQAALFVYLGVRGVVLDRFSARLLAAMAGLAGLALLTRASTGIGLYVALGLLLVVLAFRAVFARGEVSTGTGERALRLLLSPWLIVPSLILAVFLGITGFVNFYRWGNPLTVQDIHYYLYNSMYPDRVVRFDRHGLFDLGRLPFALLYYFFPIWVFRGADGRLLFQDPQERLFDYLELPPGTFILTDLLPIVLGVALLFAIVRRRVPRSLELAPAAALAAGLFVPWLLMLTAWGLAHRYRMEFLPEFDLLALLGFYTLAMMPGLQPARWRSWLIAATVVSIGASHVALVMNRASDLGPGYIALNGQNVVKYYYWSLPKVMKPRPRPTSE